MNPDIYRTPPPKRWWQSPDGEMIIDLDALEAIEIESKNEHWPMALFFRSGRTERINRSDMGELLTAFKLYRGIP